MKSPVYTKIFSQVEGEKFSLETSLELLQEMVTDFAEDVALQPEHIISIQTCSHLNQHGYTVTMITLVYKDTNSE